MDCLGIRKDVAITTVVVWPMKEYIVPGRPYQGIYLLTFLEFRPPNTDQLIVDRRKIFWSVSTIAAEKTRHL